MKWRMATMVFLSFALHGWLLWAAPVREVQAPSGVVALKLGQVKLASATLSEKEVAPPERIAEQPLSETPEPSKPVEKVLPKPLQKQPPNRMVEKKPIEKKPVENKPETEKPEVAVPPKPSPVDEAVADSELSQVSSAPAPTKQQSVSEESVLVERPAFASPPGAPAYPELARQRRQQGTVVVEVQLDRTGAQVVRRLLQSSGVDSLDEAALKAVAGWQFLPYRENGQARLSRVRLPIQFSL
ncbi:energy transducer TonB [uncultured Microbulbifer sp.]|uniref:energy transducer TonB n=1 Tax=uncultured Microbulbifer sp. TaxID=348147 RepID=UPI002615F7B2|nr:energy transducer TonB [uncultured Microbulbifer sp.]